GVDPLVHVQVQRGWTVTVLADLTGVVPYNATDFVDTGQVDDNSLGAIAALYPPFASDFAIAAGRKVIELARNGQTIVHDYTPLGGANGVGPRTVSHMWFSATAPGQHLWVGASSYQNGDGLYMIASDWTITREQARNNVNGLGCDSGGLYENTQKDTIYFEDQDGLWRRDGVGAYTALVNDPTSSLGFV